MIDRKSTLRFAGTDHARAQDHLFPGDGLEAAVILICSPAGPRRRAYVVRDMLLVPHADCAVRTETRLTWPGAAIEDAIDRAEVHGDTLILLHSHPGGMFDFSPIDDASDAAIMPGLFAAIAARHGSAIMTPDGAVRARTYEAGGAAENIDLVVVAGDDIRLFWADRAPGDRPLLAFTSDMTRELGHLSAFVVGVSGTGSLIAEQACRMGFGEVGLSDPDHVEHKNLNRIVNATREDADDAALKVKMFSQAARRFAPDLETRVFATSILDRDAILAAGEADVLFCCVDSHQGRQICDLIATAFGIPLIDMGVQILLRETAGDGHRIGGVYGRIDYVQPGGSTLEDRQVFTPASLLAEHLAEVAPEQHAAQLKEGYIKGRAEEAPSVIALNMRAASAAMMEFVARVWPFRTEPNRSYARTVFDLAGMEEDHTAEDAFARTSDPLAGSGEREPLLGLPILKVKRR